MKKNRTLRVAAILLALTLVTSCFVGGTFAKYTTSTTGSDNARVAYWGFDQDASLDIELFSTSYEDQVVSSGTVDGFENVIAPGTSQTDTFAFGYTNYKTDKIAAPEVDYTLTVNATVTGDYDSLDANTSFYWTLQAPGAAVEEYQTVAELIAAIKDLAGTGHTDGVLAYEAGELPDAFTSADEIYTIGWAWDYDGNDVADTALGNSQSLENVTITITITATQVGD